MTDHQSLNRRRHLRTVRLSAAATAAVAAAIAIPGADTRAADVQWTMPGGGDWNTASNWITTDQTPNFAKVPDANDQAHVFVAGTVNAHPYPDPNNQGQY